MGNFVVSTLFRARDRISAAFRRMARNSDRFSNRATRAFNRVNRRANAFKSTLKALVVNNLIMGGFRMMTMGLRGVVEEFIDFDQALTSASAKLDGGIFKRGSDGFAEIGKAVRKVGSDTEFSAAEAGRGLDFLAFAGFRAQDAVKGLPKVVDLATATNTDLATSVDIATDTMGAFFPKAETTAEKMKALERVVNVLGIATTSSNMDLVTMFETIKDVAPTMRMAGQEIEQFSAIAGFMANAGIKGTKSATAMKNILLNLANPTDKQKQKLKRMGVVVQDANGDFLKLSKVLDQVRKKTAKMGTRQRAATTDILFGKRAIAGAAVIFEKADKSIEDFEKSMKSMGRTTSDIADDMRKSLGNRLKALRSAAIELGFKFIEEFANPAEKGIQSFTKTLRKFDVKPLVNGVKDAISTGIKILEFFNEYQSEIKAVVFAYTAFKIALGVTTAAQWLLNVAMMANPAGAVTVAIFAVIAALGYMVFELDKAGVTWEEFTVNMELSFVKTLNSIKVGFRQWVNSWIREINEINEGLGIFGFAKQEFGVASASEGPLLREIRLKGEVVDRARESRLADRAELLSKRRVKAQMKLKGISGAASPALTGSPKLASQMPTLMDEIMGELTTSPAILSLADKMAKSVADSVRGKQPNAPNNEPTEKSRDSKKLDVKGVISFANAPPGTTFTGSVNGQPITSDLGTN